MLPNEWGPIYWKLFHVLIWCIPCHKALALNFWPCQWASILPCIHCKLSYEYLSQVVLPPVLFCLQSSSHEPSSANNTSQLQEQQQNKQILWGERIHNLVNAKLGHDPDQLWTRSEPPHRMRGDDDQYEAKQEEDMKRALSDVFPIAASCQRTCCAMAVFLQQLSKCIEERFSTTSQRLQQLSGQLEQVPNQWPQQQRILTSFQW